ncbi:hypothetical protein [Mesoterricola silvestris]|uniref:Uncharacterized protein n=1 Tax=Mesoterricola silvestris TaxID=2927979 RepID=A0AA48GQI4_9BACT|nr:hypothetical protein [Mesoterricola silvestris]BDU72360.1 hypothetical protein METEAL_15340 [Mesoterricola silvestris]
MRTLAAISRDIAALAQETAAYYETVPNAYRLDIGLATQALLNAKTWTGRTHEAIADTKGAA